MIASRHVLPIMIAVGLAGCGATDWFGGPATQQLPGERVSVLSFERKLEPDPGLKDVAVRLPRPTSNASWPQTGGYSDHAMHHLAIADQPRIVWRADVGEGSGRLRRLIMPPIAAEGRVFAIDADGELSAFRATDGGRLWRIDLVPEQEEKGAPGGGVAFDRGRLYASTGYGEVFALNPETGAVLWRRPLAVPIRSAPTVAGGRVFVVTVENQLHALAADDGGPLWTHSGINEAAGLLGAASPAADGDIVVAAYSSGELFALRADTGRVIWSETLTIARRTGALAQINDIAGSPVIDRGLVLAVSHRGRLAAIDVRRGERVWDQEVGGLNTPWVAGDFVYLLTEEGDLLCLARADGAIRWVSSLPRFKNEAAKKDPISWSGPVLASDRLIVTGSDGAALSVSPYTGKMLGQIKLPDRIAIAPVVADSTLYVLTDSAELVALR
ncbi:MAG: pyrrolo-quinoline quinone [Alphaproteobacteria bacterium]|nr:pyrrolo-quinoline quinone [Alphaproteobacteria bacterium]